MRTVRTLALGALLLAACARESIPRVARLDAHHYLGAPVAHANLTVWPIHSDRQEEAGRYLTLQAATASGVAKVREVEGEGEVQSLVVENNGDLPILICAGTVVDGGKQDRQIGQDFVIEAKSEVTVDAFCVEPGRWEEEIGRTFDVTDTVALRGVRASAQYDRDQDEVWEEVRSARGMAGGRYCDIGINPIPQEPSPGSLCDVLQLEEDGEPARRVREHFASLERRPVGFAYAVNGKPVTVRTFADASMFRDHFDAFVRSMCLEAALNAAEGSAKAEAEDVIALVRSIDASPEQKVETRAANANLYRKGLAGYHSACLLGDGRTLTRDWTRR